MYDGWDIIGVMDGGGQLVETYTRGVGLAGDIGTLVAVTHHAGSGITPGTYYLHHNHRGDVILARNGPATINSYAYSAFGSLTSVVGTDVSRFKFSSKERDASTGFSYYGYRFYAPVWQRWISRDPLGDDSSVLTIAATIDPCLESRTQYNTAAGVLGSNEVFATLVEAHLNLYGFTGNNPIGFVDLFGLKRRCGESFWDCRKRCLEENYGGSYKIAVDYSYFSAVALAQEAYAYVVEKAAENTIKNAPLAGARTKGTIIDKLNAAEKAARQSRRLTCLLKVLGVLGKVAGVPAVAASGYVVGANIYCGVECMGD